ncbi:MAG: reverse transcriptase family protein [Pseudomonadota bacterium]|nr:reverse transcriptase family protein [Pseudomonadota bacterium]
MNSPPYLVSFNTIEDYIDCLSSPLRDAIEIELRRLVCLNLPPIVSKRALAILFGYSNTFVGSLLGRSDKYYREFIIKSGRKKRRIQAPRVALKVIQKWFSFHLAKELTFEDHVYGFIPGRSSIDAAMKHCNSEWVYSFDIENFFPTTKKEQVYDAIISIGYSSQGATIITDLCCYNDHLAQGAPSSPLLSNLVMRPIDIKLKEIATRLDITVTRYADDITFSGTAEPPETLLSQVRSLFSNTSWSLAKSKQRLSIKNNGQRLKVHGLLVDGNKPRLTKGYKNKIRAYKHLISNNSVKESDLARILGHLKYAEQVSNK